MAKNRRLRSFAIVAFLLVLGVGAALVVKSIVLGRIKSAVASSFQYGALRLSVLPPALVIEDIRTISSAPFFSARRVEVRISVLQLLSREKSFRVILDQPVLKIAEAPSTSAQAQPKLRLPFAVESGFIRDGDLHLSGKAGAFDAVGVRASFRQAKDSFILKIEAASGTIRPVSADVPLSGRFRARLEGRGGRISFTRIEVDGPETIVKARGVLTNPSDPEFEFQASFHLPVSLAAQWLRLPFIWAGEAEGEGSVRRRQRQIDVQASFSGRNLTLNSFPLDRAEGAVTVGADGKGKVEIAFEQGRPPREFLDITFGGGIVRGAARGVRLDPIFHFLRVPWPVRTPAWGEFSLENGTLRAKAEFKDDLIAPALGRYSCRGSADVVWDGKKNVRVTSPRLETTFGIVDAAAEIRIDHSVNVDIKGDVTDVKEAREFTSEILREKLTFPEIRGRGRAEVKILGDYLFPQVKIDFAVAPGGFDKFDAASVGGSVEVHRSEVTGNFAVDDPGMKGDIKLSSKPNNLTARIHAADAGLERVLPALNIRIPLKGRGAGNFTLVQKSQALQVTGDFTGSRIALADQPFSDVRGKLTWTESTNILELADLQAGFYGGRVRGSGSLGFKSRDFDLDVAASDLDLSALLPASSGRVSLDLKGKGSLDRDRASGKFTAKELSFATVDRAAAGGTVGVGLKDSRFEIKLEGVLDPGGNDFTATLSYPQPDGSALIGLKGHIPNPELFLPWKGARGEVNYLLEIKGLNPSPQVTGVVDFKGPVFPIPNFSQALSDYSGLVFIQNDKASIRSLQAKLGGGDVTGAGEIRFGKGGIAALDVRADGKNMVLSVLERTRALADGSLRLLKDDARFSLSGDFLIKNLSWRRELSEKFFVSPTPFPGRTKAKGIFDGLALDIRLRADENAVLENSLGRIQGRFDLTISGAVNAPVILGDIEGLRGNLNFQDRRFRVLRARLSFFNPASIEPYLDFQGETFLKDYRVTFSLSGLVDRLRPEFASSPPLPPEDVLALLALGESFKRTYSYDTSSTLGTGSLLSFQIGEEAKKRAERLFNLDRFRIDPFVLGASSEMTARLTVGKKISRNIILLYSTNLTAQREEIIRMEWEFSDSFSLVGMRDERGRISFDAKIRKRF